VAQKDGELPQIKLHHHSGFAVFILVAGGLADLLLSSAEIFDPASCGT